MRTKNNCQFPRATACALFSFHRERLATEDRERSQRQAMHHQHKLTYLHSTAYQPADYVVYDPDYGIGGSLCIWMIPGTHSDEPVTPYRSTLDQNEQGHASAIAEQPCKPIGTAQGTADMIV